MDTTENCAFLLMALIAAVTSRDPRGLLFGRNEAVKRAYIIGWYDDPAIARRDYTIAANLTAVGIDDPDALLYEQYKCGSLRNATDYCNPEVDTLTDAVLAENDPKARDDLIAKAYEIAQVKDVGYIPLHQQALAVVQQPLDGTRLGARLPVFPDVRNVQEGSAVQSDLHECRLHAGQDAGDAPFLDAACEGILVRPLEIDFDQLVVFKNRHLRFVAIG